MNKKQLLQMWKAYNKTFQIMPLNTPKQVKEHEMINKYMNDLLEIYYQ